MKASFTANFRANSLMFRSFLYCVLFVFCFASALSVSAQNRSVSAGSKSKAAASKKVGKKSKKSKNKKSREGDDKNEKDEKPRVVKIPPRTGEFKAAAPISKSAEAFGVSPVIRDLSERELNDSGGQQEVKDEKNNEAEIDRTVPGFENMKLEDPLAAYSRDMFSRLSPQAMPGPALSFDGILNAQNSALTMPPDTVGDVGPNHYVQATNVGYFRVFNKSGNPLTPTATISTLFAGLPANDPCRTRDNGDPVVNYDPLADRWMISQFYTLSPFGQCIAVSQTGDPTGAWYAYRFPNPKGQFPDYPHWAVWTDGYYLATHEFNASATAYVEGGFYAFNRNKMLVGDPTANYVYFSDPQSGGHLPADIDGYMPPPAGTSEYFIEFDSVAFGGTDRLIIHELKPDFTTTANSTFTLKQSLPVAAFDARNPGGRADIEQPVVSSGSYLDSLADRTMFRLAYRNLGTAAAPVNSYVNNWTVNVSGVDPTTAATYQAGIRWEELRRDGAGALSIFDQGTHAPDAVSGTGRNRWMGSIAQDNQGNLALGFSLSGSGATDFPSIYWAGRTGGQTAAGTMNEGEAAMHAGTGYQEISNSRWGDYSAMTVDPIDDCTFWFTNEYRDAAYNGTANSNPFKWSTRIGNFKFPGCTAAPKGQIAANVTSCRTGQPISGAAVTTQPGGFLRMTNAGGNLISNIIAAPGNYTLTAFKTGYSSSTSAALTVTNGGIAGGNICLNGSVITNNGVSIVSESNSPANNAPDPGETLTVSLSLKNTGVEDSNNVTATLLNTGGIISSETPQNYGVIAANGGTASRNFTFSVTANAACGSTITLTFQVQDGANTYTFTKTYILGARPIINSENFDGVTAPALPAGWTSTQSGIGTGWTTSTTPASAPNAAFAGDPNNVGLSNLESPVWNVNSSAARLDFKINYDTELNFDGAVLEMKIGAGAYQDIIAAGGSFAAGGYNGTLNTGFGNPLPGRAAWTGNSGGYISSSVNLPAAANGQPIQFRWRVGSDNSVGDVGVRLDDVQLFGDYVCSTPPPLVTLTVNKTADTNDGVCNAADCSLREALDTADSGGAIDTIIFNIPANSAGCVGGICTITLGSPLAPAADGGRLTTIDGGAGANTITLSGGGQVRILTVGNGTNINAGNLNFTGGANFNGGAIAITNGGTLTLTNSTLYGNANNAPGGGLRCDSGCTANLTNVTISGNSSPNGGGISNAGTITATNCTITGNSGGFDGGGVTTSGTFNIRSTIIAGNSSAFAAKADVFGGFASQGYNLIGKTDGTNGFTMTGDQTGTVAVPLNALLGGLADNGGKTRTHALLDSSPAIDRGNGFGALADQRDFLRPIDIATVVNMADGADVGAFEYRSLPTAATVTVSGRVIVGNRGLMNATVTLTDENGNVRTARTTAFGYYRFDEVEAGQTYIVSVRSRRYQFAPQVISVMEDLNELNFFSNGEGLRQGK